MNKHVETILQAAVMDRQEIQLTKQPLHVNGLINEILSNYALQLQEKNGLVELQLNARRDLINADPVHFRNLISNLIDNAVKYSKGKLIIEDQYKQYESESYDAFRRQWYRHEQRNCSQDI